VFLLCTLVQPQAYSSPKILVQIQQTAVQSQRALNLAKQQCAAKERERRIVQLTIGEIATIEGDVNLYKGVGKMSVVSVHQPARRITSYPGS
jgi:hypothetical protein